LFPHSAKEEDSPLRQTGRTLAEQIAAAREAH